MESVPDILVIIVSARGEIDDKVDLLRSGAADYITKPFDTRELLARIEVQLRPAAGRRNPDLTRSARSAPFCSKFPPAVRPSN